MALRPEELQKEKLAEQPGATPDRGLEESKPVSFRLEVSEDKLKAYLCIEGEGTEGLNIEDIKKFLKEKGLCHGLVDDSKIEEYIGQGMIFQEPCLVAEGKPAEAGKDAQVIYHFDKDPLKIGSINAGGAIDFKNKGEIPQVKEGELIGEKIPLVKEMPGVDVYGKPIPIEPAKDILFLPGAGAKRSPDGLKIYAQIKGRPEALENGRVCVFPELRVKGDVGLSTGHISFDGFIDVEGAIQEGFRVKAGRLAAKEIYRAEVEVDGDMVIDGGIVGAKVSCRGNLKVRFIHSSQISARGDIMVEREVINSKIETDGALLALPAGKIFTSQVIAKKGVAANQIGSSTSKPCTLTIGVDASSKNIIKNTQKEISLKEEEKKKLKITLERLTQALRQLKEDLVKNTQIRDQAVLEQLRHKKLMEESKEKKDSPELAQAEREWKKLEDQVRKSEESLKKIMEQQDQVSQIVSSVHLQIEEKDSTLQGLRHLIEKALEDEQKKEIPSVRVLRQIFPGTILEGRHSSLVVKENHESALIKEVKITHHTPEGVKTSEWEMQIGSLY